MRLYNNVIHNVIVNNVINMKQMMHRYNIKTTTVTVVYQ